MQDEMFRIEIIANQSVQEELDEAIESSPGPVYFTYFPEVRGKGRQQKRFGDETWPELNCIYVLYADAAVLESLRNSVAGLKQRFPREGIKLFAVPAISQ